MCADSLFSFYFSLKIPFYRKDFNVYFEKEKDYLIIFLNLKYEYNIVMEIPIVAAISFTDILPSL
jgi:hypothetical protein